jgi:hypothetical protein
MLYIVARNYRVAKNIASLDFQLKPSEWKYIDSPMDLQGIEGDVCFCGESYYHPDYELLTLIVSYLIVKDIVKIKTFDELNKRGE